jgi:hypothetical protein
MAKTNYCGKAMLTECVTLFMNKILLTIFITLLRQRGDARAEMIHAFLAINCVTVTTIENVQISITFISTTYKLINLLYTSSCILHAINSF